MKDNDQIFSKFNRVELKYLVPIKKAKELKFILKLYMNLDHYCGVTGSYSASSLYFDSTDLKCYREYQNGSKNRKKLRIRHYGSDQQLTASSAVFVEIKQQVNRITQKRRVLLPYAEALKLCLDREIPDSCLDDNGFYKEVIDFLRNDNLQPATIVRYDREAFVGNEFDLGMRVTFDSAITYQDYPVQLHQAQSGLPMLSPDLVVLELKVNDRVPYWLMEIIAELELQLVPFSKYCRSVEESDKAPLLKWRSISSTPSQGIRAASNLFAISPITKRDYSLKEEEA